MACPACLVALMGTDGMGQVSHLAPTSAMLSTITGQPSQAVQTPADALSESQTKWLIAAGIVVAIGLFAVWRARS